MRKMQLLPSLAFFIMAQQTVCLAGRIQVGANRDKFPSSRSCYGKRGKWSVCKRGQPTTAGMIMYVLSLTLVTGQCIFEIYKRRHRGPEKVGNLATLSDRSIVRLCRPFLFCIILPHKGHHPNLFTYMPQFRFLPTLLVCHLHYPTCSSLVEHSTFVPGT